MGKTLEILMDIRERLVRIEEEVKDIKGHTGAMNTEIGELRDRIAAVEKVCNEVKFSWKVILFLIGLSATIIGILIKVQFTHS